LIGRPDLVLLDRHGNGGLLVIGIDKPTNAAGDDFRRYTSQAGGSRRTGFFDLGTSPHATEHEKISPQPGRDAAKVRSLWRFLALVYLEDPPTRRLG